MQVVERRDPSDRCGGRHWALAVLLGVLVLAGVHLLPGLHRRRGRERRRLVLLVLVLLLLLVLLVLRLVLMLLWLLLAATIRVERRDYEGCVYAVAVRTWGRRGRREWGGGVARGGVGLVELASGGGGRVALGTAALLYCGQQVWLCGVVG